MRMYREGFNVLLYGFGSKKKILDEFMKIELECEYSIIVKGYFPALSLKNVSYYFPFVQGLTNVHKVVEYDLYQHITIRRCTNRSYSTM